MTAYRYGYLHGFASGPESFKGVALAGRLAERGVDLHRFDLNVPSFSALTYTASLGVVDSFDEGGAPLRLIGSSMGGYLAARWAELHPDRVDRLVLLCPGFDLVSRWPVLLGEEGMVRWEREGSLPMPDALGELTPVGWGLIEDAHRHPGWPETSCPTLIIHGDSDETVPVEGSFEYARDRSHVRLVTLPDDHALKGSIDRIATETIEFFSIGSQGVDPR